MRLHPRSLPPTDRRKSPPRRGAALAAVALAAALAAATQAATPRRSPVVGVVDRVGPAVVNIHSERTVQGPATEELFSTAPTQNRINGMGTGVLIDSRGYIMTNQHVV